MATINTKKQSVELVIGLTAPIGTDLSQVITQMVDFLSACGRNTKIIHLSKTFPLTNEERQELESEKYYETLMDHGDQTRLQSGRKDAVAVYALGEISTIWNQSVEEEGYDKTVAIIRQLKTPEEIDLFRKIYGNRFLSFSCFSTRANRVDTLSRRLADRENEIQVSKQRSAAENLIFRDEQDQESEWGQNVVKAFPKGDVFVTVDEGALVKAKIERALEIIYGHPHRTPTRAEFGMFQAEAAALRSAALGRQVGSAICTDDGDVVSIGTNEVPKAGGGLYWEGDLPDRRDHTLGYDSNDIFKEKLLAEIIQRLKGANWFLKKIADKNTEQLLDLLLKKQKNGKDAILAGAQVKNIIEFGRCVHAEMAAIVDAARRGVKIDGCILYSTTFPCHECARHIVAAGISKVVYREPYPKSLVRELYPDSIDLESNETHNEQVPFLPFEGIAPRKYGQYFQMQQRKHVDGSIFRWQHKSAKLNLGDYWPSFELIKTDEASIIDEISNAIEENSTDV